MGLISILVVILAIVLAFMALRFLAGLIRTIASMAFFIIAAAVIVALFTGHDPFGVGPTAAVVVQTVNQSVHALPLPG